MASQRRLNHRAPARAYGQGGLQLFLAVPAPRGRPSAWRLARAARGPHGCTERARARERRSRERARRAARDAASLGCVKVPRYRRDVVPMMRLLDGVNARTLRAPPHTDREALTTNQRRAPRPAGRASAPTRILSLRKYNLDDKELGTGAFSRVILATSNEGTKVAVKCISKNGELKQEDIDSLHEEVAVLRSVDHPNIVKLYDFFDEKRYYYMAIELMEGGELFERIVKKTFYNEMDARG